MDFPRLELLGLLVIPAVAAVVVAALGPGRRVPIRWISLGATTALLLLSLHLAGQLMAERTPAKPGNYPTFHPMFVPGSPGTLIDDLGRPQPDDYGTSWDLVRFGNGAIQFYVGLDGLNIWLVVLTGILSVPAVLVSWNHIEERVNEFYAWVLLLQAALVGVFIAFDIVLFYVFFELTLVPLFFMIGIWGGPERRHAAAKFFIYTLVGSLFTLLGVLGVVLACYGKTGGQLTFSLPRLVEIVHSRLALPEEREFWGGVQFWVFLALTAGFAVKVPLIPFHTWLPLAHVEAPTAGSVDLAGILLKIGAYGFLRLCVPLAPDASLAVGLPLVTTLAAVGIIYGAFCAYAQDDIKKLVAYSSVSHVGVCMVGMFSFNSAGLTGSLLIMINHGLSTAGLFLLVGMLYERYHTRKVSDFGGMASRLPLLGAFMVFICLSSAGLPGLNGFVGEVLVLAGAFERKVILGVVVAVGMLLGAWYLFTMLQRVFFGALKEPVPTGHHEPIHDLSGREIATLAPIAVLCVLIGVYPKPVIDTARPDVETIQQIAEGARTRAKTTPVRAEEPIRELARETD